MARRAIPKGEAVAEPPAHLDEPARVKWQELAPTLATEAPGVADALACYCQAWARWTAAEAQVNALGAVVKSPAGFAIPNPYLTVAKDAQRQMRQWATVLGLHQARRKADEHQGDGGGDLLKLLGTRGAG